MNVIDLEKEKSLAERKIQGETFDFTAKYYAVADLRKIAENHPEILKGRTVSILEELMKHQGFARQRQGFFLFRETSNTLGALISRCEDVATAEDVLASFKRILATVAGHAHRAAAEALGSLPVSVEGPPPPEIQAGRIPEISLRRVFDEIDVNQSSLRPVFFGRSLAIPCERTGRLLVIKLARPSDTPEGLSREILWMDHLLSSGYRLPFRFDIPRPLYVNGSPVFRLKNHPAENGVRLHPKRFAVAFSAHKDYFAYPNAPETAKCLSGEAFREVILGNAFLAGKLASEGVVHSALIPLFHNRVQRGRRRDRGLYEWFRGGRLDQWLRSCDYPNLGLTGLRDFEHLLSCDEKGLFLYRHMGSQFLSFLLVVGSYFRNKDEKNVGWDRNGRPVDARSLFDRKLLENLIEGIFRRYYLGFSGTEYGDNLPFDVERLAGRMIDEMGVDNYMEEILRAAHQRQMSDDEFVGFLKCRGFSSEKIEGFAKGEDDIVIQSGPHLGGFNETISIPELIEAVAAMSGMCVAGRFWREKFQTSLSIDLRKYRENGFETIALQGN